MSATCRLPGLLRRRDLHPRGVTLVVHQGEAVRLTRVMLMGVMCGLIASMERRVYGADKFVLEARATRALIKFYSDHQDTRPALGDLRACLAALEVGEKSNAIAASSRVPLGKDGFGDWWPPSMS